MRTFTALLLLATLDAFAQSGADLKLEHDPRSVAMDAATPTTIVEAMLRMANVGPADFVIDLGSGDGRIVISAIKDFGARGGLGVDINEAAVAVARGRAAQAGLADRARFEAQDLFTTDVSDATVVTAYLFPKAMPRLRDKLLAELKPGTRVVSHDFPFPDWSIDRVWHFRTSEKVTAVGHGEAVLYLYTVPDRK